MDDFVSMLAHSNPGFLCSAAGRQEPKLAPITIAVTHQLGKPTKPALLSKLSSIGTESLIPFYSQHDGAKLFMALTILNQIDPAICLYEVSEFDSMTQEMRSSEIAMGTSEEDLYEFQKRGIAIGEICHSGNYFVLMDDAIFYSNHDGGDDSPFAPTFSAFLDKIAEDPAKFLFDVGCYTRYSDGTTHNQWIPETYLANRK